MNDLTVLNLPELELIAKYPNSFSSESLILAYHKLLILNDDTIQYPNLKRIENVLLDRDRAEIMAGLTKSTGLTSNR